MFKKTLAATICALGLATGAHAAVITDTIGETNEPNFGPFSIGTFNFATLDLADIVSVNLSGGFGNSTVSSSSASTPIIVDGVTAVMCDDGTFGAGQGCQAFSFSFDFASPDFGLFTDGEAVVTGDFIGGGAVRISELTLTITTSEVPLPAGGALLLGALGGAVAMRRRKSADRA